MRVPAIQQKLQEIVGADKIAKHVNADEAAVLGAAYRAADISPQFRVRSFKINDIVLHPVDLLYSPVSSAGDEGELSRQTVFAADALLGSKRKVTFKKRMDFTVNVSQSVVGGESSAAFSVKLNGVQDAVSKHSSDLVEGSGPKVKLYVTLTTSGTIQIERAAVDLETKAPATESGTIAGSFNCFSLIWCVIIIENR
jgi:hypoxia up-regulated 1